MEQPTTIVPLRAGKTRLADAYDDEARRTLRAAMLTDVVLALRGAHLERVIVACADDESEAIAAELEVTIHRDPPETSDLDGAIRATIGAAKAADLDVLVVTADLPALTANDVRAVLYAPGDVVIAPTGDGGTGALLRRPAHVIPTAYGQESAARHAARALDVGELPAVLHLPGFRIDVDTELDVDQLEACSTLGANTRAWFREHAKT